MANFYLKLSIPEQKTTTTKNYWPKTSEKTQTDSNLRTPTSLTYSTYCQDGRINTRLMHAPLQDGMGHEARYPNNKHVRKICPKLKTHTSSMTSISTASNPPVRWGTESPSLTITKAINI